MWAGEGCSGQEKSKSKCPGVGGMVRHVRVAGTEGQNKELRPEDMEFVRTFGTNGFHYL